MKNYYEILEVHPKASGEVIEKAYKVLVKNYHPDIVGNNEKIMKINEAYQILSDDFLRKQYDLELENEINGRTNNVYSENMGRNKTKPKTERVIKQKKQQIEKEYKVGTMGSMINLMKMINPFDKTRRSREKKDAETIKKDRLALILAILAVLILLVIAWFIPFTNQFVRELTVENPLFSWMF